MSSRFIPGKLYEINLPNDVDYKIKDLALIPINFNEKKIIFDHINLEYNIVMFLGENFLSRDEYSAISYPEKVFHYVFCDHKLQTFAFYQKFMLGRLIEIP